MGDLDRFRASLLLSESAEEQQPEGKCKKRSQTGIHQDQRLQLRLQFDANKKQPDSNSEQNSDDSAQYPRGKKRAKEIKRGRARASGDWQCRGKTTRGQSYPDCASTNG
jgi:hypothetical protein